MTPDIIVADRYPVCGPEAILGGSMVRLIYSGVLDNAARGVTNWISPVADYQDLPTGGIANLSVTQVPVGTDKLHRYYLDAGSSRVWPVLHGMMDALSADALRDPNWDSFVDVNHRVGKAVADYAANEARVTVHDYTLLLSVSEIRKRRPDLTLAYVHHTPWPHRDAVKDVVAQDLVMRLTAAAEEADGVFVSARQWCANLQSWSVKARVGIAHPGINVAELKSQVLLSDARGYWSEQLGEIERPVIATVGRADPAKNVDTLLRAWIALLSTGLPGTVCVHLVPTSRRFLPAYRAYAEVITSLAQVANRIREGSVVMIEDESQTDALHLLQAADIVVACSRSDGWNLVAVEAAALGPDRQHLILSETVGAVDVLSPIAQIVEAPFDRKVLAAALAVAIVEGPRRGMVSRNSLRLPSQAEWSSAIDSIHNTAAAARQPTSGRRTLA